MQTSTIDQTLPIWHAYLVCVLRFDRQHPNACCFHNCGKDCAWKMIQFPSMRHRRLLGNLEQNTKQSFPCVKKRVSDLPHHRPCLLKYSTQVWRRWVQAYGTFQFPFFFVCDDCAWICCSCTHTLMHYFIPSFCTTPLEIVHCTPRDEPMPNDAYHKYTSYGWKYPIRKYIMRDKNGSKSARSVPFRIHLLCLSCVYFEERVCPLHLPQKTSYARCVCLHTFKMATGLHTAVYIPLLFKRRKGFILAEIVGPTYRQKTVFKG